MSKVSNLVTFNLRTNTLKYKVVRMDRTPEDVAHLIHRFRSFYHIPGTHRKDMALATEYINRYRHDDTYTVDMFLVTKFKPAVTGNQTY